MGQVLWGPHHLQLWSPEIWVTHRSQPRRAGCAHSKGFQHQRLPLGDEDGEDLGALKLEQQCHTGDMPRCLVAPWQVGAKVWEAAQKHKLGMAEQREWVDGVCQG